ncbi:MAG: hypothetical protein JWN33_102 [Candidatus Saccharibacteria bacterium]|nr:hypothetical protein [Candidatus Saccharibacteria bacterium]
MPGEIISFVTDTEQKAETRRADMLTTPGLAFDRLLPRFPFLKTAELARAALQSLRLDEQIES